MELRTLDELKVRINELVRIAEQRELTEEEINERAELRAEFMVHIRRQLRGEDKK